MKLHERLFTKVFRRIEKTIYINAIWRLGERRYGLYLTKSWNSIGFGLIVFEVILYDWSGKK